LKFSEEQRVLQISIIVVFGIFALRLFYLQIIDDSYEIWSRQNSVRREIVYPARGVIFDRNRERVVVNRPIYNLMVVPRQVKSDMDTAAFCRLLGIERKTFEERMNQIVRHSRFKPSIFAAQISVEEFAAIQEGLFEFPGFYAESRAVRYYPRPIAGHLLGYTGEVNDKDIDASSGYYLPGDYIGIAGLEKTYEPYLRGLRGIRYRYVDVHNRVVGSYKDGTLDSGATPGHELELSIDIKLQEYAEQLMRNKRGSVVAIEPESGEILVMVSAPGYDPNLMVGKARTRHYKVLSRDSLKPLFNRPIQAQYPPGSIFKPFQALVAQQLGVVNPSTRYPCGGGYRMGSHTVKCTHVHGALDLTESIQFSCNPYYCWTFKNVIDHHSSGSPPSKMYETWRDYMDQFAFGRRTGIDIPNETKGVLPRNAYFDRYHGKGRWRANTIISLSIGQGEIALSPLQMATSMSAVANGGWYYAPHLVRSVGSGSDKRHFRGKKFETGIDRPYFAVVHEALQRVVDAGTATAYGRIEGITVCGKTGTAQNPHGKDHAVFVCYAPRENPKIALAVIVENAGFGGVWAAPIASLLIEKYLKGEIKRPELEKRLLEANIL
jgi:penicillin-binding protein 2